MFNFSGNILPDLAATLGKALEKKRRLLVTAESCTGGGIAQAITEIPGSSAWFERGFVTYSNLAKQEMLGVSPTTLQTYGAVSEQTALEMAKGALQHSRADISVAVTGIAGPDGGSIDKPVGTVWIAIASKKQIYIHRWVQHFEGDRQAVRNSTIAAAMGLLMAVL